MKSSLFDIGEECLGSYIKINDVNFMVVGTYKKINADGDSENAQKNIFIPFTSFSQAFNRGDNVGRMAITAVDDVPITTIKDQIFNIVRENHRIHPKDTRAIGHFDLNERFQRVVRKLPY